jgi:hypothetical protein
MISLVATKRKNDNADPGLSSYPLDLRAELNQKSLEVLVLGLEPDCYSRAEELGGFKMVKLQDAVRLVK